MVRNALGCALGVALGLAIAPARAQTPFDTLPPPVQRLSPTPGAPASFISGLNLGYLYEHYAFDLGPNVVAPRIGFFNSGTFASESVSTAVSLLAGTGGNVTRRFIFASAAGLTFDQSGLVSGVDPTFIANLETELGQMRAAGLSEILLLLIPADDAGVSFGVRIFGNQIATGGTLQNYYPPGPAQDALIQNGIGTLVKRLHADGYDDAVFAYEVLNEFNEAADNGVFNPTGQPNFNINYTNANNFMGTASALIRSTGYKGYVTVSTINFYNAYAGGVSGISTDYIDFFDLHEYNGDGSLPTPDQTSIPVVLGEAGDNSGANDDATQVTRLQQFAVNAVTQGYAGILPWYLGSSQTGVNNVYSFIVRDGSGPTSTNVRPAYYLLEGLNAVLAGEGAFP